MTEEDKITKIDYRVIDDFLPQKEFRQIQSEIMNEGVSEGGYQTLSWAYSSTVATNDDDPRNNLILFFHMIYHEP